MKKVLIALSLLLATPLLSHASTVVENNITSNTTWTAANGPYLLENGIITVSGGATLTIEPGTIVKTSSNAILKVQGTVNAIGTQALPIIFTSTTDDIQVVGGNTTTSPQAGDSRPINIEYGTMNLSHTVFRYGGYDRSGMVNGQVVHGAVVNYNGTLTIEDSVVEKQYRTGVFSLGTGAVTSITGTAFSNMEYGAVLRSGISTVSGSTFTNLSESGVELIESSLVLTNNTFTGSPHPIVIKDPSTAFTHSGNTVTGGTGGIEIHGDTNGSFVSGNKTWTANDLPYVLRNGIIKVQYGATLTIEPGAIVKIDPSSYLQVQGILKAEGTESGKIIFTSVTDDTAGGDTNGDGSATTPQAGDARPLLVDQGGSASFRHAIIRYGGRDLSGIAGGLISHGGIVNYKGTLKIVESEISNHYRAGILTSEATSATDIVKSIIKNNVTTGILSKGGKVNVTSSAIVANPSGIDNLSDDDVKAKYNWWGSTSGPSHTTNPSGSGSSVSDNVVYRPFMTSLDQFNAARVYNVAVILAEPSDFHHENGTLEGAVACRLIGQKTYPNGHDKAFFSDFYNCVTDYYVEVSRGVVNFDFSIFDNNGLWYKTQSPQSDYNPVCYFFIICTQGRGFQFIADSIAQMPTSFSRSSFDAILVKRAFNINSTLISQVPPPSLQPISQKGKGIAGTTSEYEGIGVDAHELGHILGGLLTQTDYAPLPDMYDMGLKTVKFPSNVDQKKGDWELMGSGAENQGGTNPPHLSSFSQEYLGWLQYAEFGISGNSEWITPIQQLPYGGYIFRYSLANAPKPAPNEFYIVEKRDETISEWDTSLPGVNSSNIILYYVNSNDMPELGWRTDLGHTEETNLASWNITIPNGAVLTENNKSFKDWAHLIAFKITGEQTNSLINKTQITRELLSESDVPVKVSGAILKDQTINRSATGFASMGFDYPENSIAALALFVFANMKTFTFLVGGLLFVMSFWAYARARIPDIRKKLKKEYKIAWVLTILVIGIYLPVNILFNLLFHGERCPKIGWYPCSQAFPFYSSNDSKNPDLDLHAITPDGRHIGVNYTTGEYENQIAGSIVSGDNQGIHEWIYVPETETVRYYVSAHDNQAYVQGNPEITNKTDTFDIYARTIDPATGIFTSQTLTSQAIEPTEQRTFEIGGATSTPDVVATNALIVTADNQRIPLGAEIPTLSYTLTGFTGTDTAASSTTGSASCTTTATASSPVGTYPITCTRGTFASDTYAVATYVAGTLTIAPTLTVTADSISLPLGADIPTLTSTLSGFVGTDTAQSATTGEANCTTTATNTSPVGTYPITCAVGNLAAANYIITTYADGTLKILPPLTVTAQDKTMTEGQAVPALTTAISGFLNSDTQQSSTTGAPVCTTTATTSSVPGAYPIVCTKGTLASNTYAITTFVDGTLTVEPAVIIRPLMVTAHNKTVVQGKPLPAFTYALSGFANGDTAASSTTGSASCTTTATASSPVGTYPITCTKGTLASATYTFADFVAAELTITDGTPPELQTIFDATLKDVVLSAVDSVDEQPTFSHVGNVFTLTDSAGNITKINLTKYKESATKLKVTYNSITRNGVTTSVPNTTIMYDWSVSLFGVLKDIDSKVTIKGVEKYIFNYNKAKHETKIKVKTGNSHSTTTRAGFVSPMVTTDDDGVIVAY